jgi:1-deoxy-D-xylulose-5-phosphate reductoisomerase
MRPIAATKTFDETRTLADVIHRRVTVLGSTGSIGVNTLDVIAHARKIYGGVAFPLAALTAQSNVALLIEQAKTFRPLRAVIGDPELYSELKAGLSGTGIEAEAGRDAVIAAACLKSDFVMVAIMGAAAIEPALAAINRGVLVALANKECVVAAGAVFRDALEQSGASVIPVDSEHNAIFQVLGSGDASEVEMVTITASGGPFREWPLEKMRGATVEQAVAHPNWAMGRKISLDTATGQIERGGSSPVGGALSGELWRRYYHGASFGAGHAHAHRARLGLAQAHVLAITTAGSRQAGAAGVPGAGP